MSGHRASARVCSATGELGWRVGERQQVTEALRLADLWLDAATALPSWVSSTQSWSRVEWVEKTLPVWSSLCDPVAARVVGAMSGAVPEEAAAQAGQLLGLLAP